MLGRLWVPLLISGFSVGCPTNTRDAHCTPDNTDPETTDCIYAGNGEGPIVAEAACAPLEGEVPAVCPSFHEVYAVFTDPAKGNCTSTGCHGVESTAQDFIFFPSDVDEFYEALLVTNGSVGTPYLVADDLGTGDNEALSSWLGCNIEGKVGGGFPMPPPSGLLAVEDVALVKDWLRCGAQPPPTCPVNGGDGACLTCAKETCCGNVVQCTADTGCAACAACVQMSGFAACAMECDEENPVIAALSVCLDASCEAECPQ